MRVRGLAVIGLLCVCGGARERGGGGAVGKIDQVLQGTVTVSADRAGLKELFEKVAARVGGAGGMNLVVNWTALKEAGVTRETAVSLRLKGVTLEGEFGRFLKRWGRGN